MSEKSYWSSDWMAVQQKYWKDWLEMNRRAGADGAAAKSPWEQAQEHWWQAVSPAAPAEARVFMEKMMEQGKQLFRLAGRFSAEGTGADWREALKRMGAELGKLQGEMGGAGAPDGTQRLMGFWELPLDSWQRMVSALSLLPSGMVGGPPGSAAPPDLQRLFSAPGLGYTREEQAQQQKLIRLLLEYKRAQDEYTKFFSNIGVLSVQRMRRLIEQRIKAGSVIDSARSFYDLWVATCEEVYTEQVMTPEYARINGQLVNALMAVRHQQGVMIDENLGSLHMPTRRELRTLQTRMQENRRENRRLQAQIESLRERLESKTGAPKSAPVARRKVVARKKSSARGTGVNES